MWKACFFFPVSPDVNIVCCYRNWCIPPEHLKCQLCCSRHRYILSFFFFSQGNRRPLYPHEQKERSYHLNMSQLSTRLTNPGWISKIQTSNNWWEQEKTENVCECVYFKWRSSITLTIFVLYLWESNSKSPKSSLSVYSFAVLLIGHSLILIIHCLSRC